MFVSRAVMSHLTHARHVVAFHTSHSHLLTLAMGKADPLTDQRAGKNHQHGEQTQPCSDDVALMH